MDTATTEQTRKRVRINDEVEVLGQQKTPSQHATEHVTAQLVSLLPATQSLVTHFSKKYLKLQISALQSENKILKLTRDDFIPRSASIKFKLGATSRVSESTEYKTLAALTDTKVEEFHSGIKVQILAAARLEDQVIKSDIRSLFCETANKLSYMTLLSQHEEDTVDALTTHKLAKQSIAKATGVLKYVYMDSNKLELVYKDIYKDAATAPTPAALPVPTPGARAAAAAAALPQNTFREHQEFNQANEAAQELITQEQLSVSQGSMEEEMPDAPANLPQIAQTDVTQIGNLMYSIFTKSWERYLEEHERRTVNTRLQRYATSAITSKLTDETAEVIAAEPGVDTATLNNLIEKKVHEKTKKLETTIAKLQQQLTRSKNVPRGEPANRASRKKKSSNAPPSSTNNNRNSKRQSNSNRNTDSNRRPDSNRNRNKGDRSQNQNQNQNRNSTPSTSPARSPSPRRNRNNRSNQETTTPPQRNNRRQNNRKSTPAAAAPAPATRNNNGNRQRNNSGRNSNSTNDRRRQQQQE
jgi:hypothetical protein